MGEFNMKKVHPDELRFTQDSIAQYVRHNKTHIPLLENLKKLTSGQLHPHDFPPLEVYRAEDGVMWSNDNRRLWLFREAKVQEIEVKVYRQPFGRAPPETKEVRDLMSKPAYLPRMRRKWKWADPDFCSEYLPSPSKGEYTTKSAGSTNMPSGMAKVKVNSEITVEVFSEPIYRAPPKSDRDQTPTDTTLREFEVNPNDLRFTQSCIDPYLTAPSGRKWPLQVILQKLKPSEVSSLFDDFPPLEVFRDEDGVLWCEDNERLWLFRMAGIPQIRVKLFSKPLSRAVPKMKADRDRMSKSDFFPTIRGQSPEIKSPPTSDGNDGFMSRLALSSSKLMEDGSQASIIGVAATASSLFMGFGIVPSVVMGLAGWKMSKHLRN